ncbi:MAG: protein kinase [Burkholderiaceae bacterium]
MTAELVGRKSRYAVQGSGTPLAVGRLSNIYLARDVADSKLVAVKRFHRHVHEESLDGYLRELTLLSTLDHPNILRVLDQSYADAAEPFLVLPYMEGGNLRTLLEGRAFCPPIALLPLLRQVAAGIDHAHASGVIHGDIKPENILLGGTPHAAQLADFGVGRHFVVEDAVATSTRIVTRPTGVSSAYLSPEQLLKNESSPRSDLYSLALVAYELLTGRLPFDLRAPLFLQLKARVEGELVHPRDANAQLSEPIAAALLRALGVDAARRPRTAVDFVHSLERVAKRWDVFIAHAGADLEPARRLFGCLDTRTLVFLDAARLRLGDNWDLELAAAQREALITVVLVSQRSEAAFYQREEIAAAIQMARANPQTHRVVPVYLDAASAAQPPYGLTLKHGVFLESDGDFAALTEQLVGLVGELKNGD